MRQLFSLAVASVVWVSALGVHFRFTAGRMRGGGADVVSPVAAQLATRQLRLLDASPLRGTNPEWEFMTRSFLTWSLANLALGDRRWEARALGGIDAMLARTLREEQAHGADWFLMPYGKGFGESLFVDSELALSMGLRRLVREDPDVRALFRARVRRLEVHFARGPFPPSYPDEAWTFDASVALAALRLSDLLDGTEHSAVSARWIAAARSRLIDPATGMLTSSYHLDGTRRDGPEGSSIWLACSMLAVVDPDFARQQYAAARGSLVHSIAGFGLAREWPVGFAGVRDVDSGMQVPIVEASPSSSGLAMVAAATFGDAPTLRSLLASLEFAGFPRREGEELHYAAGNQLGDAVVLYALTVGPAWKVLGVKP